MAIRTIEKTIGNSVYTFNTMNTGNRVQFLARVTKAFGPSVGAFFGGISSNGAPDDVDTLEALKAQAALDNYEEGAKPLSSEQEILIAKQNDKQQKAMFEGVTKAVELLVTNLDKEIVPQLIKDLVTKSEVSIDNKPVNYDQDFDDLGDLFKLLIEILTENFGSVFTLGSVIKV
jgi:hypothetical protein